ncbi:TPA: DUF6708 domain-containing protein [Klebsiella michiganensis]|jgi:hypothetical protein|nr:DUF6708 domain-containing protein [Klebsiella michiganensis]MDM4472023.1 hypothetical protein [Klebsiella michiganensis]UHC85431.1 hypothetical protein LUW95_15985 [Klebsiella michiganensis]UKS49100.1 hypothetical protein L3249_11950 [Klebsiella michiganensis]
MSQDAFFQGQSEAQPRLNPPIYRWQEDMPENNQPQLVPPQLIWLNIKNNIWIEIPRYEGVIWGGMLGGAFIVSLFIIFVTPFFYSILSDFPDIFAVINCSGMFFVLISSLFVFLKSYFWAVRDQPIRLNKKRQKIYAFDYKRKWWNPWAKWPATVKAYHWADIHGEMRFSSDRYTGGFQLFASVCQPGTLNVVERFQIASGSPAQLQQLWSYLCLYMKGEPVPDEAVNKGRPDFWCPRKADKWPAELERESTTGPDTELSAPRACSKLSDKTS